MHGVLFYGAPLTDLFNDYIRSYLKNTSNAQLRCCGPPQNVPLIRQSALADSAFSSTRALSLNVICIFEIAS